MSISKAAQKFSISRAQVCSIKEAKAQLMATYGNGSPPLSRRTWKPRYPVKYEGVLDFVIYARSQHLTVSLKKIQERARLIAEDNGITSFKGSCGWVQNVLRRSGIQSSIRLHGNGGKFGKRK